MAAAGLDVYRPSHFYDGGTDTIAYRHSTTFTDIDRDGYPDLAITGDFKTSQLFWNNGDGTFTDGTLAAGVGGDVHEPPARSPPVCVISLACTWQ